jgi:hypothetical protein
MLSHAAHAVQIGAIFEEEQATSRHVQFSSRRPPGDILAGLEAAAEGLGGSVQRLGDKRCVAGCGALRCRGALRCTLPFTL